LSIAKVYFRLSFLNSFSSIETNKKGNRNMRKIIYKITAFTSIAIEVNDNVAEYLEQCTTEEKRAKWRNKKRNDVSYEYLEENHIQIAQPNSNPLDMLIAEESSHDFTWSLPLPEKHKQIMIARFRNGLTIREIAEIMGLGKSTVSDYIQKSLKILRTGGQNTSSHSLYCDGTNSEHGKNKEA